MAQVTNVFLEGPAPFGFRLYGGRGDPLIISKIRVGSKAFEADLREGDVVRSLNGQDCSQLTQSAAMDIVDNSNSSLSLEIVRNDTGPGTVVSKHTQRSQPVTVAPTPKVSASDFVDFREANSRPNDTWNGYTRQEERKRDGNTTSRTVTETENYGGTTLTRVTREKTSEWSSGGGDAWKSNNGNSWKTNSLAGDTWKSNAGMDDSWKPRIPSDGDRWKTSGGNVDSWRPRSATPKEEVFRTTSAGFRPHDRVPANPDRIEMTLDLGRPEEKNFGSNYNLLTSDAKSHGRARAWTPGLDRAGYDGDQGISAGSYSTWAGSQGRGSSNFGDKTNALVVDISADGSNLRTNSSHTSPLSTNRQSVWTPSKHEPDLLGGKSFDAPFSSTNNAFNQASYDTMSSRKMPDDGFTSESILFKWNSGGQQLHQQSPGGRQEVFRTTSAKDKRAPTPVTVDLGRPPLEESKENYAPSANFDRSLGRNQPKPWSPSLNGFDSLNWDLSLSNNSTFDIKSFSSQQNSKPSYAGDTSTWKSSTNPPRSDFSSTGSLLSPKMSKFDSDKGYVDPLNLDDLDALGKFELDSAPKPYNTPSNRKMNYPDLPPEINKILSAPRDTVEDPASIIARQKIKEDGSVQEKKVYGDSSFYSGSGHNYPTVEEQVKMARIVAHSLTSDANINARGHQMFLKRKERADKFAVDSTAGEKKPALQQQPDNHRGDDIYYNPTPWNPAKSWQPDGITSGGGGLGYGSAIPPPPPLPTSLLFAPRGEIKSKGLSADEFEKVRLYDQKSKHDTVSPQVCFNLARDLRENKGKGGRMFAKRRARAEQYTVEGQGHGPDPSVLMKIATGYAADNPRSRSDLSVTSPATPSSSLARPSDGIDYTQAPAVNRLKQMIELPKAKMTPWDAMAEYGHVDPAFEHLRDFQFFPQKPGADTLSSSINTKMRTGYDTSLAPAGHSAAPPSWARNTNSINTDFSSRTNAAPSFTPKVDFSGKSNSGYRPVQFSTSMPNHAGPGITTGSLGLSDF